ncbi:MAG: hypothetical protein ACTMKV_01965 [Sphingomonas parapaucimobilis]
MAASFPIAFADDAFLQIIDQRFAMDASRIVEIEKQRGRANTADAIAAQADDDEYHPQPARIADRVAPFVSHARMRTHGEQIRSSLWWRPWVAGTQKPLIYLKTNCEGEAHVFGKHLRCAPLDELLRVGRVASSRTGQFGQTDAQTSGARCQYAPHFRRCGRL